MVLTRAFACASPVVASDIPGLGREAVTGETAVHVRARTSRRRSPTPSQALLDDEPRRVAMGVAARALAVERYSWDDIARRLEEIYATSARSDGAPHDARRGMLARNPWARGILVLRAARERAARDLVAWPGLGRRWSTRSTSSPGAG